MKYRSFRYEVTRWLGLGLVQGFGRLVGLVVGRVPVIESAQFPFTTRFEENWADIRKEAMAIITRGQDVDVQEFFKEHASMMNGAHWRSYVFLLYGVEFEEHMEACPVTASLVRGVPEISSAMFSILPPGSRLTPHYGPFKGVLRYHLGLIVPKDTENCRLVVDGRPYAWGEGKSLVFDDTFLHEAYNQSEEVRVVLFMDIVRKLPFPLSLLSKMIFWLIARSPYVQNALREAERIEGLRYADKPIAF